MQRELRWLAVTMCLVAFGVQAHARNFATADPGPQQITVVGGESWLNHLHRPFGETSMGKTGRLGPPPGPTDESADGEQLGLVPPSDNKVSLRGEDLYRLNCRGCHGEAGLGVPPEINSVIDPVRATSAPVLIQRMKSRGLDMSTVEATELAKQAQDALLQRLHKGGEAMPSFEYLDEAEIRSLLGYLKQLAGVPGAPQVSIWESPVRVGELIVKSTCHICHDATGANPTSQQLERGAIPPLETLTMRVDQLELIRKVTTGAPIIMGDPPTPHRARMPVFYYLTRQEASDAYIYLSTYRPSQVASRPAVLITTQQSRTDNPPPAPPAAVHPLSVPTKASMSQSSNAIPDWLVTLALVGLGMLVIGLSVAGMCFGVYELWRLGKDGEQKRSSKVSAQNRETTHRELVVR